MCYQVANCKNTGKPLGAGPLDDCEACRLLEAGIRIAALERERDALAAALEQAKTRMVSLSRLIQEKENLNVNAAQNAAHKLAVEGVARIDAALAAYRKEQPAPKGSEAE